MEENEVDKNKKREDRNLNNGRNRVNPLWGVGTR